ncbi:MAG TPA: HEAT repeat domain-containing protein, partial [Gemmatimonadales bacterium]|nr:HEAT repeat domain-containing protein [Gemmatimonadales bacterium]
MPRSSVLSLLAATALLRSPLAAQHAPLDSARVTQLLSLLKTSDSTVCELAGETLSDHLGWGFESRLLPMPMPMPMPTPMPMPMIHRLDAAWHGSRPRIHIHRIRDGGWRAEFGDAASLGAFRAVLRDDNACVRNVAARVLGRARPAGTYELFAGLLGDPKAGLRATGALGLGELGDTRAGGPLGTALRDRDADVRALAA